MEPLLQTLSDGILTLTMNRPEKRNALNPELIAALHRAMNEADADPQVRVVVLKGAGPAFCAGADLAYLQQISEQSPQENAEDSARLMAMFQRIVTCSKPVIGMVHGPAIAGGCGLATVCDIVLAAEEGAQFGYSEVKIGFIPAIVMVYLLRKIGDTRARQLVLTARNITATEACTMGLIAHVVPDADLESATYRMAEQLTRNSASAMDLTKQMLHALHGMTLETGLRYAVSMNALARQTEDCKTGIARFLSSTT
ncbi:MAG: enoyl-CoA hydratase/isomerase family protein [Candidatus Kapaibacteriota bacterium]|jgi:methylglutaconyl-CoA hydratase